MVAYSIRPGQHVKPDYQKHDIWTLGMLLVQMLTTRWPFQNMPDPAHVQGINVFDCMQERHDK